MVAAWWNASIAANNLHPSIERDMEQKKAEKIAGWQQVIVYSIIEQGTKSKQFGLTFDEIRSK